MEYAAIIIPTLNRFKHLKRCVDSLLKNNESKFTDLYISVDYPPSDKYKNGYSDVINYVKTISGFSSVNLYYQEKNLGPGLNRKFLENKISEKHDKYVFTDDDNEFSENFLAYINWGLEKYKNDETVYAICSTSDFEITNNGQNADYFRLPAYTPYGTGHWLHKNKECEKYLIQSSLYKIYKSKKLQSLLYAYSPMVYMWVADDSLRKVSAMRGKTDNLTYIDIWENVYCIVNNKTCVIPVLPKSRNWGLDGSGVHKNENDVLNYVPDVKLDDNGNWNSNPIRYDTENEELNRIAHQKKFAIDNSFLKRSKNLYRLNHFFGNKLLLKLYMLLRFIYKSLFKRNKKSCISENEILYG